MYHRLKFGRMAGLAVGRQGLSTSPPVGMEADAVQIQPRPPSQDPEGQIPLGIWPAYDAALVRRGYLAVWFTDEAVAAWHAPGTGRRDGQPIYCDIQNRTGTSSGAPPAASPDQGCVGSIADLLGVRMSIPDHTTLPQRQRACSFPVRGL
jgi:hypothetical protein